MFFQRPDLLEKLSLSQLTDYTTQPGANQQNTAITSPVTTPTDAASPAEPAASSDQAQRHAKDIERQTRREATLKNPPREITTISGRTYRNVTIRRLDPDSIVISHDDGGGRVSFMDMPAALQEAFGVDSAEAAAHAEQRAQARDEELRRVEAARAEAMKASTSPTATTTGNSKSGTAHSRTASVAAAAPAAPVNKDLAELQELRKKREMEDKVRQLEALKTESAQLKAKISQHMENYRRAQLRGDATGQKAEAEDKQKQLDAIRVEMTTLEAQVKKDAKGR
ncbi:MAG TPA: hypothetical protein VK970_01965 [Candidatus Methylacidiphilales bacterium]|nr:hypothetical protein [Candidatus Methylacidiphilales bacterium]